MKLNLCLLGAAVFGLFLSAKNNKHFADLVCVFLPDFILTDAQKRDMTLEEQLKDLIDKQDMTQAIKHGGQTASF